METDTSQYPAGMLDYFKQAFPDGMSLKRTFTFEDVGVATASGHSRYRITPMHLLQIYCFKIFILIFYFYYTFKDVLRAAGGLFKFVFLVVYVR